jgi:hypothetical protein
MRRLIIALAAIAALGCGADADSPLPTLPATSTDVVGDFQLRSANGNALPFVAFTTTTGEAWELASDKIIVSADGKWSETTLYVVHKLSDGTSTSKESVVSGTYAIANAQINFVMTQGGTDTFAGSVVGTELRVLYTGKLFIYVK